MNIKATHANFSVDNLEKAKEFYTKLGLKVASEHPEGLTMESPSGSRVEIYYKKDHIPWNATVFGIEVDDVEGTAEELRNMGISIEPVEGTNESGVLKQGEFEAAWIKDPASNWVCISTGQK